MTPSKKKRNCAGIIVANPLEKFVAVVTIFLYAMLCHALDEIA